MDHVTLFMFPYAGASASVYERWRPLLPSGIDMVPVELAGRGKRFSEPSEVRVAPIVRDIYSRYSPSLAEGKYALFGHSLGGALAYEFALHAIRLGNPPPVHLFVSGRAAPQTAYAEEPVYRMPDEAFLETIGSLGGTPPQFFRDEQLRSVFLPILRADYEASDTYKPPDEPEGKLPCGITVLHGQADGACDPADWGRRTEAACALRLFEGGHFFIHEHAEAIAELIGRKLDTEANSVCWRGI